MVEHRREVLGELSREVRKHGIVLQLVLEGPPADLRVDLLILQVFLFLTIRIGTLLCRLGVLNGLDADLLHKAIRVDSFLAEPLHAGQEEALLALARVTLKDNARRLLERGELRHLRGSVLLH